MRIFSDRSHYKGREVRKDLFPLLRLFWKDSKVSDFKEPDLEISENPDNADLAIIPLSWNYYVLNKRKDLVYDFIDISNSKGLKIVAWTTGDSGVKPIDNSVFTYRPSGYLSKKEKNELGMPIFITDPLAIEGRASEFYYRPNLKLPTVGFCGYVSSLSLDWILQFSQIFTRNLLYYLGIKPTMPENLQPPLFLRHKTLKIVECSISLQSNFIKRKKYRAGATNNALREKTTAEYFQNIKDSDYTLCVRGGGNFSVRFYETLAMGRIPVFVNTDCILPEIIEEWREHVVWVETNELHKIDEKILEFHHKFNEKGFKEIQDHNREIWIKQLSSINFWKISFAKILEKDSKSTLN